MGPHSMSRIITFSADDDFAKSLDDLVAKSGYRNRSKFLRDASINFAHSNRNDELISLENTAETEGTLLIYYQHGIESKLSELRHSSSISVASYNHNCLSNSHTCVDTMQISGSVKKMRTIVEELKNTKGIDRVIFVAAPQREKGCC
ncbi:MAG: ribbon-helix-helix protein, CopG family [Euryarchaeota archaeon]|nr:ribbon-helix-helix protein, CopG family [Euryarchaeota archaeon]